MPILKYILLVKNTVKIIHFKKPKQILSICKEICDMSNISTFYTYRY